MLVFMQMIRCINLLLAFKVFVLFCFFGMIFGLRGLGIEPRVANTISKLSTTLVQHAKKTTPHCLLAVLFPTQSRLLGTLTLPVGCSKMILFITGFWWSDDRPPLCNVSVRVSVAYWVRGFIVCTHLEKVLALICFVPITWHSYHV